MLSKANVRLGEGLSPDKGALYMIHLADFCKVD